eukprot:14030531-Alexandrium_andersonii.AAC.1
MQKQSEATKAQPLDRPNEGCGREGVKEREGGVARGSSAWAARLEAASAHCLESSRISPAGVYKPCA